MTSCRPAAPRLAKDPPPRPSPAGAAAAAGSSRGGDVARLDRHPRAGLHHPRRTFVEVLAEGREDAPLRQVLDQLPHDVAMRAQDRAVELRVAEETICGVETAAFGQPWLGLHLQLARGRE